VRAAGSLGIKPQQHDFLHHAEQTGRAV
jgi:hypothetical protein